MYKFLFKKKIFNKIFSNILPSFSFRFIYSFVLYSFTDRFSRLLNIIQHRRQTFTRIGKIRVGKIILIMGL